MDTRMSAWTSADNILRLSRRWISAAPLLSRSCTTRPALVGSTSTLAGSGLPLSWRDRYTTVSMHNV